MAPGVVIVTHYRLGEEFLQALRLIVPDAPPFQAVSIDPKQSVDQMREAIADALRRAAGREAPGPPGHTAGREAPGPPGHELAGEGVLILTDMFGGTPSNMALSFLEEHRVEVVTGLNLPMLIKLATMTEKRPLEELATFIKEYGQRNIRVASEILPEGRR
jgi:PTS system mannose-specific IIA component